MSTATANIPNPPNAPAPSSAFSVLVHENQAEFDSLAQSLADEFQPSGVHEVFLVQQMAQARWKMERFDRLETAALDQIIMGEDEPAPTSPDTRILAALSKNDRDLLATILRFRCAAERAYHEAHRELINGRRVYKLSQREQQEMIERIILGPSPTEILRSQLNRPATPAPASNGFASQNRVATKDLGNLALRL